MQTTQKTVFVVVVRTSGQVVGTYSTRKRASTACDKKDLQHGSYAHSVREMTIEVKGATLV